MPSGDRTESPVAPDASATESTAVQAAETDSPATLPADKPDTGALQVADTTGPAEPLAGEQPGVEAPPAEAPPAEAEKPPEPEKPKLHTDTPTLVELAGKELQPEGTQPPPTETAPPQPRSYEPFNMPEGLSPDQTRVTEAASQLFAADNLSQERAQAYVDFHIAEMQRFQDIEFQARHDDFANVRAGWVKQVMADPVFGGNNFNTAMKAIAEMRDLFVSASEPTSEQYAKEMKEFNEFLTVTGAGDHPAFNRLLHNVARKWAQPAAPTHTYKPPADIGRRPNGAGSRRQALYGQMDPTPRG